jgi:hypothetical protein
MMTTKTFHGFTLWAVPRFHRSDAICPEAQNQERKSGLLHQFATLKLEDQARETLAPRPALPRDPATCH